jgi:hypothetical protein
MAAPDLTNGRRYDNPCLEMASDQRSVTIWVGDAVDLFRLHPDGPRATFRLRAISLLVPAAAEPAAPTGDHPGGR